jgi:hypothetical protein
MFGLTTSVVILVVAIILLAILKVYGWQMIPGMSGMGPSNLRPVYPEKLPGPTPGLVNGVDTTGLRSNIHNEGMTTAITLMDPTEYAQSVDMRNLSGETSYGLTGVLGNESVMPGSHLVNTSMSL